MELQVSRVQLQNSMLERRNTELQQLYKNEKEKRRRIRDKLKLYKVRGRRRREEINVYLYNEMNDMFLSVKLFSNINKMRKHFFVYSTVHMFTSLCISCVYIMFLKCRSVHEQSNINLHFK